MAGSPYTVILGLDPRITQHAKVVKSRAICLSRLIPGLSPMGAKIAPPMDGNRRKHVKVRLDRTISFPKLVLTGLFGLMVRSSRTMTKKRGRIRRSPRYLSAHGVEPEDDVWGGHDDPRYPSSIRPRAQANFLVVKPPEGMSSLKHR
jgi:hypothetical protein